MRKSVHSWPSMPFLGAWMAKSETFIKVIEHAISDELCDQFVTQFDSSKNILPGRTGGGIDTDKKRSSDVSIITHPEFNVPYQALLPILGQQILRYFEEYFFALIGPIGLTVKHPKTGQPVKLTHDNFAEVGLPNLSNFSNCQLLKFVEFENA